MRSLLAWTDRSQERAESDAAIEVRCAHDVQLLPRQVTRLD
jgi:hypothetical protein